MTAPETEKPAAKCDVQMHDGKACARDAYDEKGLCICHSEDPNKDRDAFNREIEAMLERKDYDFTRFLFPGYADFGGRVFDGRVWFRGAKFQRAPYFLGATFQDVADFWDATFERGATFVGATFAGEAWFFHATFQQGLASFSRATFQRDAHFSGAWFQGGARFTGYDNDWAFSREADADFRWAHFAQSGEVRFEHVFLGRARFLGADVRQVDFTDVEWAPRGRHRAVWDEMEPKGPAKNYALIGKLYRQLKHNYEEQRDPITAGDFHFGEMHMRRLSDPPRNNLPRFLKRNLSFLALYRWISGYGEDYILPLAWIAGVIVAFALAFAAIPALALQSSPSSGASHAVAGWQPHVLYSVMCFLLRGDKPLQPAHLAGHYVSVAEGILGPPLIAMFVLALNRRFKR